MNGPKIGIALGTETEPFLKDLLREVDDSMLDELEVHRELESSEGLNGEPITTGVIITGTAIIISALLRLIERRMEHSHQHKTMKIVAEGFESHPDLGTVLADIAKKNADVSISYGIATEAWSTMANTASPAS